MKKFKGLNRNTSVSSKMPFCISMAKTTFLKNSLLKLNIEELTEMAKQMNNKNC
jgi:hypothetical protein